MQRAHLAVALILMFPSAMLAQHASSSGGGHSSSGSSGGGSHSSSTGGSASSASSHSSSGTASHVSSARSSSAGTGTSHSIAQPAQSNFVRSIHEPVVGRTPLNGIAESAVKAQPEKKSVLSFLRRPFRRPEPAPKPVADLRHRVCSNGMCRVCPSGSAGTRGGCVATFVVSNPNNSCSRWDVWSGAACLRHTRFVDDCRGLRSALENQARRMQQAQATRDASCSASAIGQECSDFSATSQSEASLYRALQDRFRQCQQRSLTSSPYGEYSFGSYSPGLAVDSLGIDVDYR